MSKSTPGPWRHILNAWIVADAGVVLTSQGMEEANARLIAAAPDMLAALQSLLEDGGRVSLVVRENLVVWSGDLGALSKARAAARAAIAKATGEA
jgi:hypothetical protein